MEGRGREQEGRGERGKGKGRNPIGEREESAHAPPHATSSPSHTHAHTFTQLFQAIIGCVYLPTCPLAYDDREQFVQGLLKNMDSFLFIGCVPTGNTTREGSVSPTKPLPPPKPLPPKPVPVAQPYYPSPPPPPAALSASKSELRRGSFQPSSGLRKKGLLHKGTPHLTERRGSLTDLRMRPKEMNMVSIADLRNSPNPRTKERKATKVAS